MKILMTIPIIPTAQMRARSRVCGKHAMTYKAPKQARNENQLMQLLAENAPSIPVDFPVSLEVVAYLPIPASWSKKKKEQARMGFIYPIGKPDLDNLVKNIKDCMTQCGFWTDDSRVWRIDARKRYMLKPGWVITMEWYENGVTL